MVTRKARKTGDKPRERKRVAMSRSGPRKKKVSEAIPKQ
jgi:hypothetical protein